MGVVPPASMTAHGLRAPSARPRRSASARPLTDLRAHFEAVPVAHATQQHGAAGRVAGDAYQRILSTVRFDPVDVEQQVPGLQPGALRRTADVEIADDHARVLEPELLHLLLRHILRHDADPAADDAAVGDDVVEHPAHHVHGDREADALDADTLGDDRGVDAHQRAAGI